MFIDNLPIGTQTFIFSKLYYSVLSKRLETLEIERYFSILLHIKKNTGCTQQQICDQLMIDKTAMVKVIDYLVSAGYVERKVNPNNRRQYNITLTEIGSTRADEIIRAFDDLDKYVFSGISESERKVFLETLHKMSHGLKDLPANPLFFNYKKTK